MKFYYSAARELRRTKVFAMVPGPVQPAPGSNLPDSPEQSAQATLADTEVVCESEDMSRYAVIIHEEPGGGFWGEVPALPGCYSQGESIDELLDNIREAMTGVLDVMREQGREPEYNIRILEVAV